MLTAIQAVIEEEQDSSLSKLILCGSHVSSMEALLAEQSPLHGRLYRFFVPPLGPSGCAPFIEADGPRDWVERFSVSGGMPMYLEELGRGGPLRRLLEANVLSQLGTLFEEPPFVLQQELRTTGDLLLDPRRAGRRSARRWATSPTRLATPGTSLTEYLRTLQGDEDHRPRAPDHRAAGRAGYRYRMTDGFFRFWFRFVRPFASELEAGLKPARHCGAPRWDQRSPNTSRRTFEALCRHWVRANLGGRPAGSVAGGARRSTSCAPGTSERSRRSTSSACGAAASLIIGECKWTTRPISVSLLAEIEKYKLPALRQSGAKIEESRAAGGPLLRRRFHRWPQEGGRRIRAPAPGRA